MFGVCRLVFSPPVSLLLTCRPEVEIPAQVRGTGSCRCPALDSGFWIRPLSNTASSWSCSGGFDTQMVDVVKVLLKVLISKMMKVT